MIVFNVTDPETDGVVCGLLVSQRWMAEQWAARRQGRTIEEVQVSSLDKDQIDSLGSAAEAEWCQRVGLVDPHAAEEPIRVPTWDPYFGPGCR